MRLKIFFLHILIFGIFCGCHTKPDKPDSGQSESLNKPGNLSGTLKIAGAYALYPLVQQWAEEFMSLHPGATIEVEKNGTTSGLSNILQQSHNLAMISRDLTAGEETTGIWKVPVAKDGVVPIINRQNPYIEQIRLRGLKAEQLIRLFTQVETASWGDILDTGTTDPVKVLMREEGSGTAEIWANFLWLGAEDLKGEKVFGDEEMIKGIQGNPFAIGYSNLVYVFDPETGGLTDEIEILPIDFNQNGRIDSKECPCDSLKKIQRAIWIGKYPRQLCRNLYLVSMGKPIDKLTIEFINWILTEGQEQVNTLGYSSLNNVQIKCALRMLHE